MNDKKTIIGPENLLLHLTVDSRTELFRMLAEKASELPAAQHAGLTTETIRQALENRETQASTALGCGIVFPHARLSGIRKLITVIATLSKELDYEKPDEVPVQIACLLLIPENHPMEGLRFISAFAKSLQDQNFRQTLLEATDQSAAFKILEGIHFDNDEPLRASDIMAAFRCNATPEMPLKDATVMMMKFNADVIPVLDGRKLAGEISCTELFKLGIPDFFSQLKSVGFIRYFDPFEKYFSVEAGSLVKNVMHKAEAVFPPDATLIEIVFAISVQHHPLVYIVSPDNELLGVIDQALLLERIINL